ncbi:hypothetical protein FISHEDRAFT_68159 [Fistulina hepatica ATCC 64428]|uniref:C2H2-type domain-containing protein n=1 Tax=Fistulina hepatica ATCC 64428 TaxID=1128425 RepID=A0A0D7A044_9AGAR|nr:hypothetical protein FISHEDRAFT_68159 [Fistulina hepatica ATCC 64428]
MPITMQSGFSSRPRKCLRPLNRLCLHLLGPSSSLNLLSWSPSGAAAPASNSIPIHAQRPRALSPYSHPAFSISYRSTSDDQSYPSYNNQVASPPFVPSSPSSSHSTGSRRSRENSPKRAQPKDPNERRRIPCLITGCNRRFTSQYTLKVHMEAHKPKPRASFPCTLGCSERFSRQHDRLRHEVAKHGKVCEFSCHECGRFFSSSKTLGNHKCPAAQGGTRWVNT